MGDYSSDSSCSSDSESDVEIEAVLKKIPKASVPEVKAKRKYTRAPMTDEQKKVLVEKLAKARAAKKALGESKKQSVAQEAAELKELKTLKDKGQLKVKKERPSPVEVPKKKREKQVVIKEVHHHYGAPVDDDDEPKPAKVKKQPAPPKPPPTPRAPPAPRMVFA